MIDAASRNRVCPPARNLRWQHERHEDHGVGAFLTRNSFLRCRRKISLCGTATAIKPHSHLTQATLPLKQNAVIKCRNAAHSCILLLEGVDEPKQELKQPPSVQSSCTGVAIIVSAGKSLRKSDQSLHCAARDGERSPQACTRVKSSRRQANYGMSVRQSAALPTADTNSPRANEAVSLDDSYLWNSHSEFDKSKHRPETQSYCPDQSQATLSRPQPHGMFNV